MQSKLCTGHIQIDVFTLLCSFRFMLNPTGNYIYQLADPDINFDWDTIEQVVKYP